MSTIKPIRKMMPMHHEGEVVYISLIREEKKEDNTKDSANVIFSLTFYKKDEQGKLCPIPRPESKEEA